ERVPEQQRLREDPGVRQALRAVAPPAAGPGAERALPADDAHRRGLRTLADDSEPLPEPAGPAARAGVSQASVPSRTLALSRCGGPMTVRQPALRYPGPASSAGAVRALYATMQAISDVSSAARWGVDRLQEEGGTAGRQQAR